jgi:hypothetical protein
MPRSLNDASHRRGRAAKMRAIADGYSNKEAADTMYRLADDYDKLAERAKRRSDSNLKALPSVRPKGGLH